MPRRPPTLVFLDTETTGLDPARDRVVEIAALRVDDELAVVDRFVTLLDPGLTIPLAVTRKTGITQAMVRGAATFVDIAADLEAFLAGATVVGHNVAFDVGFLQAERRRAGREPIDLRAFDTLEAALLLFPELDRHALPALADHLGLGQPAHRAQPDAEVTVALFAALCRRAAGLGAPERRLLEAADWAPLRALDQFAATPDVPPPLVANEYGPEGPEPLVALPCDENEWHRELTNEGRLAGNLKGFRERPGQVALGTEVAGLLAEGGIGLFEAGTGMGKSLAYLLPAAFFSAARGSRVLVSTKTKALQRQLAARELPAVTATLPAGWRWAVLMGRENYLCRRRLEETVADTGRRLDDRERALALAYLLGRTRRSDVDLSALPYRAGQVLGALSGLGHELRSSSATCLGRRCRVRPRCHWRAARLRAEAAHVVVVNHALLLSGGAVLPPFEDVIVDEAHLLPDEATSAFSEEVNWTVVENLLRDLGARHGQLALATRLERLARARQGDSGAAGARPRTAPSSATAALRTAATACQRAAADLPQLSLDVGSALAHLAEVTRSGDDRTADQEYGTSLWLTPGLREQDAWDAFALACALLADALTGLAADCATAADVLPEDHRDTTSLRAAADAAARAGGLLKELPELGDRDRVTWGELEGRGRRAGANGWRPSGGGRRVAGAGPPPTAHWKLTRAPLTPAGHIRQTLWDRLRGAVLTSATLTVQGEFAYFRRMAGLTRDLDVREQVFPSPFDYRQQAVLVLEHAPGSVYAAETQPAQWAEHLRRLTEVTGGRTLALFTNKRHMEEVAHAVGASAERDGVLLLAQGLHGSAGALADEFRRHTSTVLLGVDALWTGQDFPGDALVCLVIAKLPFGRQDPLFHARRLACEEEGRDWFREFYLPEAVLRFRQGFGRLIRTEHDTGVVVVLDRRLTDRAYQSTFLASLPDLEVARADPHELAGVVALHLNRLGATLSP